MGSPMLCCEPRAWSRPSPRGLSVRACAAVAPAGWAPADDLAARPLAAKVDHQPGAVGQRRDLIEAKRTEIREVVQRHHGRWVAVFGSVARGDETPANDIDLLVEFEPGSSLFDLLHISEELGALLGVSVDVVSAGGLKDRNDHIRREAIRL